MTVYLCGAAKGGVGKSTLAVNLAGALAYSRSSVLLVDADESGNSASWAALRTEALPDAPRVVAARARGREVRHLVRDSAERYADVVIDVGARDSDEARAAMLVAETMLIPTKPNQWDLWQYEELAERLDQARDINSRLTAWSVISQASTNWTSREAREAREMLQQVPGIRVADTVVHSRKAFSDAAKHCMCTWELGKRAVKASEELDALFRQTCAVGVPRVGAMAAANAMQGVA